MKEEVVREEKQREEEAATKKKKEREERKRHNMECKEERELAAVKARVAKYEAEAKARAEAEESPGGSDAALDDEIVITGVIDKVSDSGAILEVFLLCEQVINHQDGEGCEHCKWCKEVCRQLGPGRPCMQCKRRRVGCPLLEGQMRGHKRKTVR